ncbi:hypothetical protein SAMN02745163_03661 [Clostridium cavendishii DSM 21758]|uniref:Uncharacterized protein n=1 Tax=Clostridium cavendishii DSM 21758 TaxID=1121302 RepID=A0A1M6RSG0_9CLOT|nr:hypothetical protein [Clostridium cavendishii]SHK35462.1 hypothetical protein SAMN02745163_03661 [Clostridium cavendishii DSM 21758]
MDSLQLLVEVYSEGIGCGMFTIEETINFCDKLIEYLENPPYEIIEVSLMSQAKINDIENKLSELNCYSEINRDEIVKIILSVIYKKYSNNEIGIVKAIKCTDTLLIHTNLSYEDEYYDLYGLDDSYYLAQSGTYGDLDEVVIQFKDAISRYESYYKKFEELIDNIFE